MTAGAYGAVQAGTYNSRPLVPEVLVRGRDWAIVRERIGYDAMIGYDRLPGWIGAGGGGTAARGKAKAAVG